MGGREHGPSLGRLPILEDRGQVGRLVTPLPFLAGVLATKLPEVRRLPKVVKSRCGEVPGRDPRLRLPGRQSLSLETGECTSAAHRKRAGTGIGRSLFGSRAHRMADRTPPTLRFTCPRGFGDVTTVAREEPGQSGDEGGTAGTGQTYG